MQSSGVIVEVEGVVKSSKFIHQIYAMGGRVDEASESIEFGVYKML